MPDALKPMRDFDPTRPAVVHDRLNDKMIEWKPDWADHYRQYADDDGDGLVGWDGLSLNGWR